MAKTVLITGACSGIGLETTREFSNHGWKVVATGMHEEDLEKVRELNLPNVSTYVMDVTQTEHIKACFNYIDQFFNGELDVLVNNAGSWLPGSVEMMPIEDIESQFQINTIAPVAVSKTFLPALKRTNGKIINVSSMNGRVSMIGTGAYSASKFALEALSDALRMELFASGVSVVLMEPGQIRTELFEKAQLYFDKLYASERQLLDDKRIVDGIKNSILRGKKSPVMPSEVARKIVMASLKTKPRHRYVIGADAHAFIKLRKMLSSGVMDKFLLLLNNVLVPKFGRLFGL